MTSGKKHRKQILREPQRNSKCIGNASIDIDIRPLSRQTEFDDNIPFVKRLTIIELLRISLLGDTITGYDLGSLRLTLPHRLLASVWRLRNTTVKLRGYLYWKFVAHRYNIYKDK